MSKAKTTEYMPSQVMSYIYFEMDKAGIKRNQLVAPMKKLGYGRNTVYNFFKQDEHGQFKVTVEDGQNLLDVVNALLIENKHKPLLFTVRGTRIENKEVFSVYTAMRELAEHLIPLLDARSMRELAYHAWSLYRTEYPECPEFFELDLHPRERHLPPSWRNWEQLTPEEQHRLTKMYEEAKTRAEEEVSRHAEAERLHEKAEIIAGDRYPDNTKIMPAEGWAAWEQSKENDTAAMLDCLRWWYDTCPGGEEYDSERQRLEGQIEKLKAEQQEAKQGK